MSTGELATRAELRFQRHFTKPGEDPYETVEWGRREARAGSGIQAFLQSNVEAPLSWSDQSVGIVAKIYFATLNGERESSIAQPIRRLVTTITHWGGEGGYFPTDEAAEVFRDELTWLLLHQYVTFNTPAWLNLGVPGNRQCVSACFLLSVNDELLGPDSIVDWWAKETQIFKAGAGSGINLSPLRGSMELLSTGGKASGPVTYMRPADSGAGTIKSGGVHRRAAKLVRLDADHPDIEDFVACKVREDERMQILMAAGVNLDPTTVEGERNIAECTTFQNENISVGVTDEFMRKATGDDPVSSWPLTARVTGKVVNTIDAKKLLDDIAAAAWQCADPGLQYHDTINTWHTTPSLGPVTTSNPCLTGDTLVAVADGRGAVSLAQLAREDLDVPVYTRAYDGAIVVRTMRHPRLTGSQVPVYKITLDDGSTLRATGNHKFRIRNGAYVRVDELTAGVSFDLMTRYAASMKKWARGKNDQPYWWISGGLRNNYAEHRLIAAYQLGRALRADETVHHVDNNGLNNRPHNLEPMLKADHDALHRERMLGANNPTRRLGVDASWRAALSAAGTGEKNPRYLGVTNDEIRHHTLLLSQHLGYRFTGLEWAAYARARNLPTTFSAWRRRELGNVEELAQWTEDVMLLPPRPAKELFRHANAEAKLIAQGYEPAWIDNRLYVIRLCEGCGKEYRVLARYREVSYCGKCRMRIGSAVAHARRNASLAEQQVDIYLEVGPCDKKMWQQACRDRGVSFEISRGNSPFRYWSDLQEAASMRNHKVVQVEADGYADVYNGTVDEYHNFFVGGFESTTRSGRPKFQFVNTQNCGETMLNNDSSCNLGTLNIGAFLDNGGLQISDFRAAVDVMITAMDITCSYSDLPTETISKNTRELRQLGLGFTNLGGTLMRLGLPYDSDEGREFAAQISALMTGRAYRRSMEIAAALGPFKHYEVNRKTMLGIINRHREAVIEANSKGLWEAVEEDWDDVALHAKEAGFRNSQVTLVQPGGTTSFMVGADTTGVEPAFSLVSYKGLAGGGTMKIVNGAVGEALETLGYDGKAKNAILALEQEGDLAFLKVIQEEHVPVFGTAAGENPISPMAHVHMVAAIQPFLSQSISKTINLPNSATVEDIREVYVEAWRLGCKAVSVYRDGSKATQVLRAAATAPTNGAVVGPNPESVPKRHKMPAERQSITRKFTIDGHEGYVTAGMYEDGTLGEIFLHGIGKDGSTLVGMANAWAIAFSIALQHGVPLETLVQKYINVSFPPAGPTNDPAIPFTASIPDYIARRLAAKFLSTDVCEELGVLTPEVKARRSLATYHASSETKEKIFNQAPDSGKACKCGAMMVRTGICWACPSCGTTTGCG